MINRLELIDHGPPVLQSTWRKAATWLGTRVGRALSSLVLFAVWIGFAMQLVASEFLNYHTAGRGWLNQPLIQLPWMPYLPESMEPRGQAVLVALLLILLCALARWLTRRVQKLKAGRESS